MDFGPLSHATHNYSGNLLKFMQDCTSYVGNLHFFDKYCLWRYTIGSASINSFLIFKDIGQNSKYWCYLFFLYFNNTFGIISDDVHSVIPRVWNKYKKYLDNPSSFLKEGTNKEVIDIIKSYIRTIDYIIGDAPRPKGDIEVYKVASQYPGLPNPKDFKPATVKQMPFNSTTVDPHFSFAVFISQEVLQNNDIGCCFFRIHIKKGQPCLYIPKEYHAWPFENEIILPQGINFNIKSVSIDEMNYVDPTMTNIIMTQDKNNIIMGPVYDIEQFKPCKGENCVIKSKKFYAFDTTLSI